MIGVVATNLHGYQRTTDNIDVWIEDSLDNRKNSAMPSKNIAMLIISCWKPCKSLPDGPF